MSRRAWIGPEPAAVFAGVCTAPSPESDDEDTEPEASTDAQPEASTDAQPEASTDEPEPDAASDESEAGDQPAEEHTEPEASTDEPEPEPQAGDQPAEVSAPRRVSDFHEIRDGGFGMGSAAPLDDGAQPLDHPVQAYRDTMTYRLPEDDGYADAVADVWFYDAGAAERSGFHRSEG